MKEDIKDPGKISPLTPPMSTMTPYLGKAVPDSPDSRDCKIYGPYELLKVIGHGGSATVYCARRRTLRSADSNIERNPHGSLVALKIPHHEENGSDAAARLLLREGHRLLKINHPNILPVIEVSDSPPYLATPWFRKGNLATLIREKKLPETKRLREWLIQIGGALVYLHEKHGSMHRDVKPENMLIRDDGQLVLSDLGLARNFVYSAMMRRPVPG